MLANAAGIDNQTVQSSATFTATSTTTRIYAVIDNSGTATIDNVSVRLAEEDRSVNGNGLQVFGTVTKSAVATGADLVAYSGFSTSNYLQQPYNSDFDFGTGDFCIMGWLKVGDATSYDEILERADGTNYDFRLRHLGIDNLRLYVGGGDYVDSTSLISRNTWLHFVTGRWAGNLWMYIDGKYEASNSNNAQINIATDPPLRIGQGIIEANRVFGGYLSLLRISATAPSPEQIAKIYEGEKFLFQENAQATLYGSSDAVTALAYDDSTELLHVGTSAGRSVFQGLRRVDNTTTAVGAAISASNGLVADE